MLDQEPDIIASHGPPHGILDFVPMRGLIGSQSLEAMLRVHEHKPLAHFFGHCHRSGTDRTLYQDDTDRTIFSNAAATRGHVVMLKKD